jgi:hypothetical protein
MAQEWVSLKTEPLPDALVLLLAEEQYRRFFLQANGLGSLSPGQGRSRPPPWVTRAAKQQFAA